MRLAESITTKNITSVDEVQSVDNTDKVFVNDNGSFKQISVSNLMKQAPSGVTEETDPTVSEWAKQPTKPLYTADEVGALPVGTKYRPRHQILQMIVDILRKSLKNM